MYDVYNNRHEHVVSLKLCKNYLRDRIQHRTPEFEILSNDETTNIGRISSYSTDFERTEYGHAAAMKSRFCFFCINSFLYLILFLSSTRYES